MSLKVYVRACLCFLVVGGYQLGALTINCCFVWCSTEERAHNAMKLESADCSVGSQAQGRGGAPQHFSCLCMCACVCLGV